MKNKDLQKIILILEAENKALRKQLKSSRNISTTYLKELERKTLLRA